MRPIWQRDDLQGGEIESKDNRIVVTYFLPGRWADPPIVEEFSVTPHGLQRLR